MINTIQTETNTKVKYTPTKFIIQFNEDNADRAKSTVNQLTRDKLAQIREIEGSTKEITRQIKVFSKLKLLKATAWFEFAITVDFLTDSDFADLGQIKNVLEYKDNFSLQEGKSSEKKLYVHVKANSAAEAETSLFSTLEHKKPTHGEKVEFDPETKQTYKKTSPYFKRKNNQSVFEYAMGSYPQYIELMNESLLNYSYQTDWLQENISEIGKGRLSDEDIKKVIDKALNNIATACWAKFRADRLKRAVESKRISQIEKLLLKNDKTLTLEALEKRRIFVLKTLSDNTKTKQERLSEVSKYFRAEDIGYIESMLQPAKNLLLHKLIDDSITMFRIDHEVLNRYLADTGKKEEDLTDEDYDAIKKKIEFVLDLLYNDKIDKSVKEPKIQSCIADPVAGNWIDTVDALKKSELPEQEKALFKDIANTDYKDFDVNKNTILRKYILDEDIPAVKSNLIDDFKNSDRMIDDFVVENSVLGEPEHKPTIEMLKNNLDLTSDTGAAKPNFNEKFNTFLDNIFKKNSIDPAVQKDIIKYVNENYNFSKYDKKDMDNLMKSLKKDKNISDKFSKLYAAEDPVSFYTWELPPFFDPPLEDLDKTADIDEFNQQYDYYRTMLDSLKNDIEHVFGKDISTITSSEIFKKQTDEENATNAEKSSGKLVSPKPLQNLEQKLKDVYVGTPLEVAIQKYKDWDQYLKSKHRKGKLGAGGKSWLTGGPTTGKSILLTIDTSIPGGEDLDKILNHPEKTKTDMKRIGANDYAYFDMCDKSHDYLWTKIKDLLEKTDFDNIRDFAENETNSALISEMQSLLKASYAVDSFLTDVVPSANENYTERLIHIRNPYIFQLENKYNVVLNSVNEYITKTENNTLTAVDAEALQTSFELDVPSLEDDLLDVENNTELQTKEINKLYSKSKKLISMARKIENKLNYFLKNNNLDFKEKEEETPVEESIDDIIIDEDVNQDESIDDKDLRTVTKQDAVDFGELNKQEDK
jgi:hypothetical protein